MSKRLNVLSWGHAIHLEFKPAKYGYCAHDIPVGECIAKLDCKIWAKKILAINCYFTNIADNSKFQLTVYCNFRTGLYQVPDSIIAFANCHYTLYYYDMAGQLVKTVPPKGVKLDFSVSFINSIKAARITDTKVVPAHEFTTNYRYNSLSQVVAQLTPMLRHPGSGMTGWEDW